MNRTTCIIRFFALIAFTLGATNLPAAYVAQLVDTSTSTAYPYNMTGLIRATGAGATGSGSVVRYPKVVLSCAHVVYDFGWQNGNYFYRRWNSGNAPTLGEGHLLRGYWYFSNYSFGTSDYAFALDFVAHYSYEDVANGGYAGWVTDGISALKSSRSKLITGYPSALYSSGDSRKYRMHRTGPFTLPFVSSTYNQYVKIEEVSTGGGNSGGPVWIQDGGNWYFAGVLVSGLERRSGDPADRAGVRAMNGGAWDLVNSAYISAGGTIPSKPVITEHPSDVYVYIGDSAILTASASGSPSPSYRWQANFGSGWVDLGNSSAYSGTGSGTLTIHNVTSDHANYRYRLSAANSEGITYSSAAAIHPVVVPPPTITSHPQTQSVLPGESVTFSVNASGVGALKYQWLHNGVDIPGATAKQYTVFNAQQKDAGNYRVRVTTKKVSVLSAPAKLIIIPYYQLSLQQQGTGSFSMSPTMPGTGYVSNTLVTVTATPSGGAKFYGWTGGIDSSKRSLAFRIRNNELLTGWFIDSDLLWHHADGRLATSWLSYTNILATLNLNDHKIVGNGWKIAAAGDFDNDGSKDLLFQKPGGDLAVWYMDGNDRASAAVIGNVSTNWVAIGSGDFNGDGRADIVLRRYDHLLGVWMFDAGGAITKATLNTPANRALKPMGVADMDGDGYPDILLRHDDGRVVIWYMDAFARVDAGVVMRDGAPIRLADSWRILGAAKINGDASPDLVMQHADRRVTIWFMNGENFVSSHLLRKASPWRLILK